MASIKCGNRQCKGTHASVAAVKLCYELSGTAQGIYCTWCEVWHTADEFVLCLDNLAAQQEAELDAERRVERWFEEGRGAYEPDEFAPAWRF